MVDLGTLTSCPTFENLKCFVCKNYLSYFPISLCSNNKSVCGRCAIPEGLISFENESFEEICQHFKFPCRFQSEGCPKELLPKDIPQHEDKCPFRVVECIINNPEKCQWQGSLPDLLRHCENQHSDLILKNHEFEMDPTETEERDNLVKFEETFLVFRRKYDPRATKLTFGLCYSKYERTFEILSCQLSVKNDRRTVLFDFESSEFQGPVNEVLLKSLYSLKKPHTFLVKLTLPENKNGNNVQENKLNRELLKFLNCVKCSRTVKPPAYCCINGMSLLCFSCYLFHNSDCEFCSHVPHGATHNNIQFDQILKNCIEYPCKNNNNGCRFSSNYKTLEKHQVFCEYENIDCPLSESEECPWKGHRKDLKSHILDDHTNCIHISSEITYDLRSEEKINMSFMKFSRHLFRLSYEYEDKGKRYEWSLQKIGDFDTNYRFEVEIFGDAPGLRFLVGAPCSALSIFFKCKHNFCYILNDQVSYLKKDKYGNLKFKVRISEM